MATVGVSRKRLDQKNNKSNTYDDAVTKQTGDYDDLMRRYRQMLDQPDNDYNNLKRQYESKSGDTYTPERVNPTTLRNSDSITPQAVHSFKAINAEQTKYDPSADVIKSLGDLKNLADTGGYSSQDIADLRARGISPIRAIYANAQRNLQRNRSLQGGYSPNFAASSGRMARESSEAIAGQTTSVNAGIADSVAKGKLAGASSYASASAAEQAARAAIESGNTAARNRANEFNSQGRTLEDQYNTNNYNRINELNADSVNETNRLNAEAANRANEFNASGQNRANEFNTNNRQTQFDTLSRLHQQEEEKKRAALEGMRSSYGTTPALTQLYGDQANRGNELALEKKRIQQSGNGRLIDAYANARNRGAGRTF